MKGFIAFAVAVGAVLAFTNPNMDDFSEFAQDRSEEIISDEIGDTSIGRALTRLGSSLAGDYVDRITDRKNYLLFSTYAIGDPDDERWSFLGIANHFFELHRPQQENSSSSR